MNRELLSRRLKRSGYEVVVAVTGREAVEQARTSAPDLILMDLSLPEMDGWEATRQLKANHATRRIPIIALTAHAMRADLERAIKAGCDQFETKPVMFDRLVGKMESFLQRQTPD
jgi:CheY-like chemotaxis protein